MFPGKTGSIYTQGLIPPLSTCLVRIYFVNFFRLLVLDETKGEELKPSQGIAFHHVRDITGWFFDAVG